MAPVVESKMGLDLDQAHRGEKPAVGDPVLVHSSSASRPQPVSVRPLSAMGSGGQACLSVGGKPVAAAAYAECCNETWAPAETGGD